MMLEAEEEIKLMKEEKNSLMIEMALLPGTMEEVENVMVT